MMIQQISVFVENKPGRLAEITEAIGRAGIDIRALSVADTSDFGILRLIVDNPDKAAQALRDTGLTVSLTDVIAVGIPDEPGAFSKAVKVLADAGVNVEYMYAFISRQEGQAYVILRVENPAQGVEVLQKQGIHLLSGETVYHM